jgi:hypothetical protein
VDGGQTVSRRAAENRAGAVARDGVDAALEAPVFAQRRIRDLDDQLGVLGVVAGPTLAAPDDRLIGLRAGKLADRERELRPDPIPGGERVHQQDVQALHQQGMGAALLGHGEDDPVEELGLLVGIQNPDLAHPEILLDRDPANLGALGQFEVHGAVCNRLESTMGGPAHSFAPPRRDGGCAVLGAGGTVPRCRQRGATTAAARGAATSP